VLEESGFSFARQNGSHVILQHLDGRSIVVPIHQGEELGRGILRAIIRQAGLTREEFDETAEVPVRAVLFERGGSSGTKTWIAYPASIARAVF